MKAAFDRLSAAYYLSVPERVLTDLVDAVKIPHRKIGKKVLFIHTDRLHSLHHSSPRAPRSVWPRYGCSAPCAECFDARDSPE
jgi:hypothetical protein